MKSITQLPPPEQQQEHHHAEAEEEVTTLQQQRYSTDDSVLSEGAPQHEEAPATWQLGEEAAAVAAAAAAVEGGVEKELVAAAERTSAGTVKSRGRGSPRLRLYIMRQCSEGGVNSSAEDPAAAVAAALGAAAAEDSGAPPAAGDLLKTKVGTTAAATADLGGARFYGSSSREAAGEKIAPAERKARQEALQQSCKLLLPVEGAADTAAAAELAPAGGRLRTHHHHHHHLLLHPDDDEEEEEKNAAPNESTCSNKAWSRRRNSKQELMSISAADRDRLLLDTGHSLEDVEERWWKGYFGDQEDMQRTRTRIAARRRTLEKFLEQNGLQQKKLQQEGQQHGQQDKEQQTEKREESHGMEAIRTGGLPEAEQAKEAEGKQGSSHEQEETRKGAAATEQQQQQEQHIEVEEEQRRRRLGEGLLTVQSWWEEVVETETGRSFVAAAGHKGGDASCLRLSYKEIDRCANAVALWAVVAAAGVQRRSTGTTRWSGGSRGSSMSSSTAEDGPTTADLFLTEKQQQQEQQQGVKKETEERQLSSHEAAAGSSLDGNISWWQGSESCPSAGHLGGTRVPLQPNDVVVLLLSHPFECLLLLLGLLKANLVPALVPTHLTGEALEDAVHAAEPAYIIADSVNLTKLYAAVRCSSHHRGHGSSSGTRGNRGTSTQSEGESEGDSSSKDRGTIPSVGRTFFMEGGDAAAAGQPTSALEDLLSGASACAAWFGCPTSLYASPGGGRSSRATAATTATLASTIGEKCLLTDVNAVLAVCGVACDPGSSSSREAAALCGVALPPQCPPLREVLQISAAARLACKGNSPCLSCLRRGAVPAVAAAALKLAGGSAEASPVIDSKVEKEMISSSPAAAGAGGAGASVGAVAASDTGGGQEGKCLSGWYSSQPCVYEGGSSPAAAAASSQLSQWGALHPAVYFYATVPVARGLGSSRWRRATAAEQADAEVVEGLIERGGGGREAEDAEEVEKSLQPALLSHETVISIGIAWRRRMQLDVGDVVYCPASLQAETGCLPAVLAALEARASLVFPRSFNARLFWPHIDCFRCTYTTYFPHMWRQLFAGDFDAAHPLAEGAASLAALKEQAQHQLTPEQREKGEEWCQEQVSEQQQQQQLKGQQQVKMEAEGQRELRRRRLRGCAGEGMTAGWWHRVKQEAGESLKDFVEYHFRPHWPVSSPLINYTQKMDACGFVPNSVQGKRATARLVRYDQRRKMVLRRPDSGHCFDAELRSKQEHRTGEAIVRLEKHHTWLGFANADVTRSLLLENAFTSGDVWCRSGDLMNVDRLGFFYFVETLG